MSARPARVAVALSAALSSAADRPPDRLHLRDFDPRPMLRVEAHEVPAARYPAIDFHQHVNDAASRPERRVPVRRLLDAMDRCNVRTLVILTGGWGQRLQRIVDEMVRPHPGRFVVFVQPDWGLLEAADGPARLAALVRDGVRRGARGLKVLKELGLSVRAPEGGRLAVDDARLDPMWAECGRLGIPVAIHTADPDAFFQPLDGTNERYDELIRHPEWHVSGAGSPAKAALLAARDRVFARHPETRFVALHVGGWPENLDAVSAMLDRFPNVMVDLGARQNELGRQPRRARRFVLDYQDRILFGTDRPLTEDPSAMYRSFFRWLETADEHFPYHGHPRQGRWMIYGLDLPDAVLEKVYRTNAERLLARSAGLDARALPVP